MHTAKRKGDEHYSAKVTNLMEILNDINKDDSPPEKKKNRHKRVDLKLTVLSATVAILVMSNINLYLSVKENKDQLDFHVKKEQLIEAYGK